MTADDRTRKFFDLRADDYYRRNYERPQNRHAYNLAQRRAACLALLPSIEGTILDLGCGSGRDSFFLAERGFSVWGVDISEPAVRRAIVKSRSRKVHFLVGDAERLPFPSGAFDGVYSRYALNRAPLNAVSSEIFR